MDISTITDSLAVSSLAAEAASQSPPAGRRPSHADYEDMRGAVAAAGQLLAAPLFTTDAPGEVLWRAWLGALPWDERSEHDCRACRSFVERFGGLVTIDPATGRTRSWLPAAPGIYAGAFADVAGLAEAARVTGVFLTGDLRMGVLETHDKKRGCSWRHVSAPTPGACQWRRAALTPGQRAAEVAEDRSTLLRALADFREHSVEKALAFCEAETLYRGEKIAGRLRWLLDLKKVDRGALVNLSWLAAATAPAGFCHVRSSVVGSLLEDVEAGRPHAEIKARFDAKMHPLQYQRPQAAPSAGNIAQAEALVEKMGLAPSLHRRFARMDDVLESGMLWSARRAAKNTSIADFSVFGHLLERSHLSETTSARAGAITWEKFARTVLPGAEEIRALAPGHGHYTALVTAAVPDAPPILQWDREGARNPVSWYTYVGGRSASSWNLRAGAWVPVTAVVLMPNTWAGGHEHHGRGVLLAMEGCRDITEPGVCLFPELLRSDLHGVRATIEAHSREKKLEGAAGAELCGLTVRAGSAAAVRVAVLSRGVLTEYTVDRWD